MAVKNSYILFKMSRGIAMIEMLPLLVVFITLFGLCFGFWASIHSATLSSIAARHYAFEVLNNRTHFDYHRSDKGYSPQVKEYYTKMAYRVFAVVKHQASAGSTLKVQEKNIQLFDGHAQTKPAQFIQKPNRASPIWIKSAYGICIDYHCGE